MVTVVAVTGQGHLRLVDQQPLQRGSTRHYRGSGTAPRRRSYLCFDLDDCLDCLEIGKFLHLRGSPYWVALLGGQSP